MQTGISKWMVNLSAWAVTTKCHSLDGWENGNLVFHSLGDGTQHSWPLARVLFLACGHPASHCASTWQEEHISWYIFFCLSFPHSSSSSTTRSKHRVSSPACQAHTLPLMSLLIKSPTSSWRPPPHSSSKPHRLPKPSLSSSVILGIRTSAWWF